MRQFYLLSLKVATVWQQFNVLTWSHYKLLLTFNDIDEIKYYISISSQLNLSVRELRERIKTKEYERLGEKIELEEPKVDTLIKNPILIKVKKKINMSWSIALTLIFLYLLMKLYRKK